MWIWQVARSDGGNLGTLIANAHRYGINTLFIKSGDGTSIWSQFNSLSASITRQLAPALTAAAPTVGLGDRMVAVHVLPRAHAQGRARAASTQVRS